MKILWLYASEPLNDHNHWYHLNFAKTINQQKDTELLAYGYGLEETQYSNLVLIPFKIRLTAIDLHKIFPFDIIIMDNRYRFFRNPFKWNSSKFFNLNNIPIVMIEGDFHLHKNEYLSNRWFLPNQINLILHRHYNNFLLGNKIFPQIKQIWFPCSVNTDIFKPNPLIKREPLICSLLYGFAPEVYPYRRMATKILEKEKLTKDYRYYLKDKKYPECLQSYISHINCSSIHHIDTAKMFEIMASGSVLFTDEGDDYGLQKLFPKNTYCTYNRNGNDVLFKGKKIINETAYRDYLTANGLQCINKKHTHNIRANELINIIKGIL